MVYILYSFISDIDECISNPCPFGFTCENNPGSYKCLGEFWVLLISHMQLLNCSPHCLVLQRRNQIHIP